MIIDIWDWHSSPDAYSHPVFGTSTNVMRRDVSAGHFLYQC